MERDSYRRRPADQGLIVPVPNAEDRATVHRIIYAERVAGKFVTELRDRYRQVMARLADAGAEAVILGCTETSLLIRPGDS